MEEGSKELEACRYSLIDGGVADDKEFLHSCTCLAPDLHDRPPEQANANARVDFPPRAIFPPVNVLSNDRISTDDSSNDEAARIQVK